MAKTREEKRRRRRAAAAGEKVLDGSKTILCEKRDGGKSEAEEECECARTRRVEAGQGWWHHRAL